jgi:hypothetical protein
MEYFGWINPVAYQVPRSYVVPVNFGLFILGNLWQAALAIDALRMKNILQLYSISILNVSLFVFSVMRYFQTMNNTALLQVGEALGPVPFTNRSVDYWGKVQPALLTSTIIVGLCTVTSSVLVYLLQRELRWAIYRHISGSLEMLRRYLAYQVRLNWTSSSSQTHCLIGSPRTYPSRALFLNWVRYYLWFGQRAFSTTRVRVDNGPHTRTFDTSSPDHHLYQVRKYSWRYWSNSKVSSDTQ